MKKTISFLLLGTALTFAACGKDKKAANDPAPAAAAPADPAAKPADPNAAAAPAAPAGGDQAKPEEKKAGGW